MRRFACLSVLTWLGMLFPSGPPAAAASPVPHPIVAGFERFGAHDKVAPARGGQLLLGELGCVSCHKKAETSTARKQGPVLDFVGTRVRIGYLKKFLRHPHTVKPGTTMPALFSGDPDADGKVEALVHFLAATGSLRQERPDLKAIAAGRDLYNKVGCVACHGSRDAAGKADKLTPASVPLGDLKAKYSLAGLVTFLSDPHQVRPSGRMPRLLSAKEPHAVANYLLQGIKVDLASGKGATSYIYYEGGWDRLPDFAKLKPAGTGIAPGFDLGVARRDSNYAIQFAGYFKVEREAQYTFSLHSDDGSRLAVDGKVVVNNDGTHPPQTARGRTRLTKGIHKIAVDFFQGGGGAELGVQVDAPGFGSHNLSDLVAVSETALEKKPVVKPADADALDIQPALVEKGKVLFATAGCASCHQLSDGKNTVASRLTATPLAQLKAEGGCLSAGPVKGLPWYGLDAVQKTALAAALRTPPAASKKPAEVIARAMTTFNCYACHQRDKIGGPEEALNKFFQTAQPEMGDEARVPPPLDGVGAKLNPEYLRHLLDNGVHDRPYMHTRMPGFGNNNVGFLVEVLGDADRTPKARAVTFKEPLSRVKSKARHLMGAQTLGCIKCHTFAGHKAEGVQGIDMTMMPTRLKHDWFRAYVTDPQSFRPGTRMPSSFVDGKSVLPDVLDGTANAQIEAMWLYLKDGPKARLPVGMSGSHSTPLVPGDTAIIYRNFIQGAGTRAIGVGYPEKVNLAFDANEMRLALLWHGAFIDAGRHWNGRGEGFEGPLGDDILALPGGAAFAILSGPKEAWPATTTRAMGYKFRGYRLTPDDRPTFLYALRDVKVEDFSSPVVGKETTVRRTLSLTAPQAVADLYYRAAVGSKIEDLGKGWYRVDEAWKLKVEGAAPAQVRQSGGKRELLVPVRFKDGKTQVVQEYSW